MSEGRALVFPRAITLGARPLTVPGGKNVLVASASYAFRLSDGGHIEPAAWYETVSGHAGPLAVPDAMVPLPGAELMVLGAVSPVEGRTRRASVRCGGLARTVVLCRDPEHPDNPFVPDTQAAIWHEEDNPGGRGGPDDDRPALIVAEHDPDVPVWFGPTPFDHPLRLGAVGTPDPGSGTGWPTDASAEVFHDAHPAFRTDSFSPDDPLAYKGLGQVDVDSRVPPYRIAIISGREDGRFLTEPARIHAVTLIPSAGMGAVFWRACIDLGDDLLGETVHALVAALEDIDSPLKDAEHWGRIAANRWLEPHNVLDDRPLLPRELAASVVLPFAMSDTDPMKERHAAADEWMKAEVGMGEKNPFGELAPDEQLNMANRAVEESEGDTEPPDINAIDETANSILAAARRRHEEAEFKEPDPDAQRIPEVRGDRLEAEIRQRLSGPYQSARDRDIVNTIRDHDVEGVDADDIMQKLAHARRINPDPPLAWPLLDDDESRRFGDVFCEAIENESPGRHVDVAAAAIVPGPEHRRISGRRFDGLFAEYTVWNGIVFSDCEFLESSFCQAKFKDCEFRECRIRDTNLSSAELVGCRFVDCTFAKLRIVEPSWMENRFEGCCFEGVSLTNAAMRDTVFDGGSWDRVDIADGLLMDMTFRGFQMNQVTLSEVMAPQNRFERVSMTKVWVMSKGPAASVFEDVEAETCGFLGYVRFDRSTFTRARFANTGFTNAVFADNEFTTGCQFDRCDFSGAMFSNVGMEGIRFIECSMTGSKWSSVRARNGWFHGALLRGVDFADTELANAVFTDADLEGTRFLPDKTIGADFRGTVKANS